MNPKKALWTERYRPSNLSELILPKRIEQKLQNGVYGNFMFYGSPGNGKSSTAKVLTGDNPTLWINASMDTGIDHIRTTVTEFCSTLSVIDGEKKLKYVVFDEFDGCSSQAFLSLKSLIEQFAQTTRFIATCNHFNKIPEAIQSRFECFNFDYTNEEEQEIEKKYIKRVYEILKTEGIDIDKDALFALVARKFPDLRSIVGALQGYHAEGKTKITIDDVKKFQGVYKDLYEHIINPKTNEVDNYQFLMSNYVGREDDIIATLGTDFIEYIQLEHPLLMRKVGEICFEVNRHSYELHFVVDPAICMLSLVYKLQSVLRNDK